MKKFKYHIFNKLFFKFFCLIFLFFCITQSSKATSILDIDKDELIIGDINAPVTIIEYASLSCHHCANFHVNTLPQLIEEYVNTGKIKIVFRDFPLNYPALMGSMVLQCIDSNIRYDYLSLLYILQSKWVKPEPEIAQKEVFKIVQASGMTKDQFESCLNNEDQRQKILRGLVNAQNEFTIGTTPSFLINGTLLTGSRPFKSFKKIIDNLLTNID